MTRKLEELREFLEVVMKQEGRDATSDRSELAVIASPPTPAVPSTRPSSPPAATSPDAIVGDPPTPGFRWKLLAIPLAAVALATVLVLWWRGPLVASDAVLRRDFVQTVVASGHVETPHRIDVGSQMTGTVLRVPVAEGQVVKAGDLLVELESAELKAAGRQADAAVVQAQLRLRQLREVQQPVAEQTLRQAQTSLDNARATLGRNQKLAQSGFISAAALDEFRKAVDLADAQLRVAGKQLDTTGASGSGRALAEADIVGAQAGVQAAQARTGYSVIVAPVAGTLIGRNVEAGDVVQPGKLLMTLSPQGRTQLIVEIDEKNLGVLALGQQALASADAYPKQRFPVQLAYINPGVNAQTGAVEVKLDVDSPPPGLRQDMTVSVDIAVARRPNALLIPASSVHDADGATPWVLRVEAGRAVRRPVRLGLNSGGFAEVLEGLAEGDHVIPVDAAIVAGAHVRLAPAAPSPP